MPSRIPDRFFADIAICIGFYTRIVVPQRQDAGARPFAAAQWAAPVAGAVVGFGVGLIALIGMYLGLPATVAAVFALGAGIMLSGALHEDGLADTADGFGGGHQRSDKLAIMRDSHIGSYGVLALGLSLLARFAAIAALAAISPFTLLIAVIAAHAASRAILPALMVFLPPARQDGLAAGIGHIDPSSAYLACGIGFALLLPGGFTFAIIAALFLACIAYLAARIALAQIGGQTGDVLGAIQQLGEIAILAIAAALLT